MHINGEGDVGSRRWELPFRAEPAEVADLRRATRVHLQLWGIKLQELIDTAQLCVTELVSNVITHIGRGTQVTLNLTLNGTRLRIELHDPDTRALPTLLQADSRAERGRGLTLLDAVTAEWGVILHADRKVTWCELETETQLLRTPAPCEADQKGGITA